jgi:hypothetical protein
MGYEEGGELTALLFAAPLALVLVLAPALLAVAAAA